MSNIICLNCDHSAEVATCGEKKYLCHESVHVHSVEHNHSCTCFIERKIKGAYTSKVSLGENDFYIKEDSQQ